MRKSVLNMLKMIIIIIIIIIIKVITTITRAHCKHDGFTLILSSVSWKLAVAHQRAWEPNLFSNHCNQHIINFA